MGVGNLGLISISLQKFLSQTECDFPVHPLTALPAVTGFQCLVASRIYTQEGWCLQSAMY